MPESRDADSFRVPFEEEGRREGSGQVVRLVRGDLLAKHLGHVQHLDQHRQRPHLPGEETLRGVVFERDERGQALEQDAAAPAADPEPRGLGAGPRPVARQRGVGVETQGRVPVHPRARHQVLRGTATQRHHHRVRGRGAEDQVPVFPVTTAVQELRHPD